MAKRKSKTHPESFEQKGRHSTTEPITWAEERPSTTDHLKSSNLSDMSARSGNLAESGHNPDKANPELTQSATSQDTLQCTIGYDSNGLVTVKDISWRASDFPKYGTYVKLYVLTEGKYRKKKKKTEVVYKVLYGERKFRKHLKIQCKEKDSLLILSVWKKELKSQPIARVCIQLRHMMKGRFYEERCPLTICTKTDVKTDNKAYFELNQEEPEEMDIEENQMTPATTQIIAASTPSTRSNTTPTGLQKRKESQNKRMEGRQSISEYNSSSNLRQQAKFQLPLVTNQEKELSYDRSQEYRQNIDKGDKFQYVPRRSPSLPNTVTGTTLQRRQRLPSKIQGNNYGPHPPVGLPNSPIRSTRRNSRATYPSSGLSVDNDIMFIRNQRFNEEGIHIPHPPNDPTSSQQGISNMFHASNNSSVSTEKKVNRPRRMVSAKRQLQNANFIDQLSKFGSQNRRGGSETYYPLHGPDVPGEEVPRNVTNKPQSENRQKPNTHPHLEGKPKVTTLLQKGSTTLEGTAVSAATNKAQSENAQHLVTLSHQEGPPKVTTFSPSGSTTLRDLAVSRENTAPIHNDNRNLEKDIRLEDTTANKPFPENNSPTKQYSETVAGDKARHPDHSAPLESSSEDNFEKKYPQSDVQPESSINGNSEGKSNMPDRSCDLPKSDREDNPSLKENNKNYQVHSFVSESTWTTIRTNTQLSPHASIKNASSPHSNYPVGRTSSGRAHVTGIPNLGNTCYANSVLQVLGKSPSLQSCLENCQKRSGELLKKILTELNTPGTRCVNDEIVHHLLRSVFKREDSFRIGRQDDSHAFFLALINCVQADSDGNPCEMFEGMMTNIFKYNTCDHEEYSDEQRFTSLLMPIANQENLYACIKDFCSEETFEKNLLQCRMCEEKHLDTVAKKQLVFTKLPMILVLQMGRFEEYMDYRTKRIRKNIARIKFSNEIKLDEKGKSIPYDLYGVVNHLGSIHGGHYTATVRLGNSWYRCSDTHVSTGANPTTNPNGDAYLLFYSRKEDVTMQQ